MKHMQMNIGKTNTYVVSSSHDKCLLVLNTALNPCWYNKGKFRDTVNFASVVKLFSVRLLIICLLPLKETYSQLLLSNATPFRHRWAWTGVQQPTKVTSVLTQRKRSGNCFILLLTLPEGTTETNQQGSLRSSWCMVTIVTETSPSVSSLKNTFRWWMSSHLVKKAVKEELTADVKQDVAVLILQCYW